VIDLGDLSGGQEQIDRVCGITPEQIEKETQLLSLTHNLHYKSYESKLEINTGYHIGITLELHIDYEREKAKEFARKCYNLIKPLVDELNNNRKTELESQRKEIIEEIIMEIK